MNVDDGCWWLIAFTTFQLITQTNFFAEIFRTMVLLPTEILQILFCAIINLIIMILRLMYVVQSPRFLYEPRNHRLMAVFFENSCRDLELKITLLTKDSRIIDNDSLKQRFVWKLQENRELNFHTVWFIPYESYISESEIFFSLTWYGKIISMTATILVTFLFSRWTDVPFQNIYFLILIIYVVIHRLLIDFLCDCLHLSHCIFELKIALVFTELSSEQCRL